jgi:2,4-diaminopentanoate dehydrogenase
MSEPAKRPIRVAQWATGTVGAFALRGIIEHPDLELVGVRVFSAAKDGVDAGELCGLPATGVRGTRDNEAILALKPDCVVYMPDSTDTDMVCRLLESGSNIVTTRPDFFNPEALSPALRQRVEAACRTGGTSIHSTGSSPGFITEVVPLALLSVVRRLDFLALEEYANCREGCSEQMLTELMGFGDTPEGFAQRNRQEHASFEHSMTLLANAVGLPIDKFESSVEFALCTEPTKLHRSTIPAGTVGAQRVALTGFHDGEPVMRFRSNWFVTRHIDRPWTLLETDGWQVTVEGDAPLDVTIRLPMLVEEDVRASGKYTAHRPVNVIPYVVAAQPGIVPTTALAQVVPNLARRKAAERPG